MSEKKSRAERDRRYYEKNREAILERKRARYWENPEYYRQINALSAMRCRAAAIRWQTVFKGELVKDELQRLLAEARAAAGPEA
ncbi:MAG: hypothetical protein Q4G22_14840 [Paracoccus sp. (in: a-proteobacteria)]|uniref:hypothetical protein n=1 Tax=Paracoccus sp. TaxID=267 RepID=UPI0026E0BBB3|nr:hypothetical protein [Paracoccus sp. (in: a-proteobacteria)]MDO5633089.1 hypothetical protein [Paracoccus sp. (in: a-proteobacteria)]